AKESNFLTNISEPGNEAIKDLHDRIAAGPDGVIQKGTFTGTGADASTYIGMPLAVSSWGQVLRKGIVIVRVSANRIASVVTPEGIGTSIDDAVLLNEKGAFRSGVLS